MMALKSLSPDLEQGCKKQLWLDNEEGFYFINNYVKDQHLFKRVVEF